ncbi:MAG: RnfABCDGE type electron transport complex subunit D [Gammaproteobacteria bacterium]|nr:RnfABCDGE type electron transport complex subunit D [Gammaproteobacteria bacterium]
MTRFDTSGAPYLQPATTVSQMMSRVLLSLVPAAVVYTWFFGPGLLLNILVASGVGLLAEASVLQLRKKPLRPHLGDYSVLVTAVLFAWCLPPATPWWITAIGMVFAVVFAKHLYGGLGHNPFNPAMAGYVLVLISFPQELTRWLPVSGLYEQGPDALQTLWATLTGQLGGGLQWDAVTMATPLDYMKTEMARMTTMPEIKAHPMFGDFAGRGYEWVANFIALGGAWLIYKRVIRWHIPVAVLVGVLLPATLVYVMDPGSNGSPGLHLFSGATMLGAFYIATDPVSAATSPRGRLIYGFGVGVITLVVRKWGGYPDGIAFGVLLMNAAAPLIDHFTRPRVYGHEE